MLNYKAESQKMYNDIKADIKDLSPISSGEVNWYKFVTNIIGLSDVKANEVLWEQSKTNHEEIDWRRTYDELDMLHGDTGSLIATIEDECNHNVY